MKLITENYFRRITLDNLGWKGEGLEVRTPRRKIHLM